MDVPADPGRGGHEARARPHATLGHGGLLGILVAIPLAALSLVGAGHALVPHRPPHLLDATLAAQSVAPCFTAPPAGVPAGLPHGYRFLWELSAPYGNAGQQSTWVYNRSCADPDAAYPVLVIRLVNPDRPLSASDLRRGSPVDLERPDAQAVYYQRWLPHDLHGLLCRGSYWFPDTSVSCRWDAPPINLLMVQGRSATYAILGGRSNGIGEDELETIAQELPGARG